MRIRILTFTFDQMNNDLSFIEDSTFQVGFFLQILAQDFLKQNYVFLAVGRVGSTSDNIEQNLIWVEETQKRHTLGNILENEGENSKKKKVL